MGAKLEKRLWGHSSKTVGEGQESQVEKKEGHIKYRLPKKAGKGPNRKKTKKGGKNKGNGSTKKGKGGIMSIPPCTLAGAKGVNVGGKKNGQTKIRKKGNGGKKKGGG